MSEDTKPEVPEVPEAEDAEDADYVRRIVRDKPGRIARLQAAGWTIAEDGSHDSRSVLMEIPIKRYNENQTKK